MVVRGVLFHAATFKEVVVRVLEVVESGSELVGFPTKDFIEDGFIFIAPQSINTSPLENLIFEFVKVGNAIKVVNRLTVIKHGNFEVNTIKSRAVEPTVSPLIGEGESFSDTRLIGFYELLLKVHLSAGILEGGDWQRVDKIRI